MVDAYLETYLNDHLAGSEAALELLEHLERGQAGTPIARFAADLRVDIEADRHTLEGLMERLQVAASRPRKVAAWLAEKFAALKLRLDDRPEGALNQLEVLEALSLGIEGKRLLWRALGAAAEVSLRLGGTNYEALERRAEDQRDRVEELRLAAAKVALGSALSAV